MMLCPVANGAVEPWSQFGGRRLVLPWLAIGCRPGASPWPVCYNTPGRFAERNM